MLLQVSNSRPASASIVRLSRPSLFAAAARVTKEQERQDEGQTVGKTATRAKLQLVLRHTPQLHAVLKGLPHLHSGHSLSGGDALQQGEGGGEHGSDSAGGLGAGYDARNCDVRDAAGDTAAATAACVRG